MSQNQVVREILVGKFTSLLSCHEISRYVASVSRLPYCDNNNNAAVYTAHSSIALKTQCTLQTLSEYKTLKAHIQLIQNVHNTHADYTKQETGQRHNNRHERQKICA